MRIFVTGASGWIGSAVVAELLDAGHQPIGLARSESSAARIEALGATAVRGDLDDPEGLAALATDSDGVIHLAFQHDVAFGAGDFTAAAAADRSAVEAMGRALAGSDRPFVLASGMLGLAEGRAATEADGLMPSAAVRQSPLGRRAATALLALSLSGIGVRPSIVRYAPTVHGEGDGGFMATIGGAAVTSGRAAYVGDGANRWPAVHISDAARLTRLAAEAAPAGTVLHAAAEEGVAFKDIAEAISRRLGVPTESLTPDQAFDRFAHLGFFVALDCPASSHFTRQLVGWEPSGPSLVQDLEAGHYFGFSEA